MKYVSLILMISVVTASCEFGIRRPLSRPRPDNEIRSEIGNDANPLPDMRSPDLPFSNISPSEAIGKVAKTQSQLLNKTTAMHQKLDDLPVKMTENFDKTMTQLERLQDRIGTLGTLFEFVASYGVYLVAFCATLPFLLIFMQVLILWKLCTTSTSQTFGSPDRLNVPVDIEKV